MFTSAGSIMVKIDDVKFADPKFATGANDFDICIHGTSVADPNQSDYARLEMSQNYGKGNFASMTQAEISMKTLRALGFEGDDLTTLKEQIYLKEVPFHVEESKPNESGKTFFNVKYIETGAAVQEIDKATVNERVKALFAGVAAKPAPAATPVAAGNPFAKKAAPAAATPAAAAPTSTGKLPF
ncbi:MAG: hypothetical protein WC736_15225 [Gallionella sp.]